MSDDRKNSKIEEEFDFPTDETGQETSPFHQKTTWKQYTINIIKYLFSAGLIAWMIVTDRLNFSSIAEVFTWDVFLVGFILLLLNISLCSERWHTLVRIQGFDTSRWQALKLYFVGMFFNLVMPGGVGGDVIKGYYFVRQNPQARTSAMTTIFMDRLIGLYIMILMAAAAMTLHLEEVKAVPQLWSLYLFITFIFFVSTVGGLLLLFTPLFQEISKWRIFSKIPLILKMQKAFGVFRSYGKSPLSIISTGILSFIAQVFSILFLAYVGNKAGILDLPLEAYFFLAPLGFIATAIPISPSGIGVGQAAFLFLFDTYSNQKTELGALIITVFQVTSFAMALIGAYFYMTGKHQKTSAVSGANEIIAPR